MKVMVPAEKWARVSPTVARQIQSDALQTAVINLAEYLDENPVCSVEEQLGILEVVRKLYPR